MIHTAVVTASLLVVATTMVARCNDSMDRRGWYWQLRKFAFAVVGGACIGFILFHWKMYFTHGTAHINYWFQFYESALCVGLAGVFFTTPNQKPWWEWVTRGTDDAAP